MYLRHPSGPARTEAARFDSPPPEPRRTDRPKSPRRTPPRSDPTSRHGPIRPESTRPRPTRLDPTRPDPTAQTTVSVEGHQGRKATRAGRGLQRARGEAERKGSAGGRAAGCTRPGEREGGGGRASSREHSVGRLRAGREPGLGEVGTVARAARRGPRPFAMTASPPDVAAHAAASTSRPSLYFVIAVRPIVRGWDEAASRAAAPIMDSSA